mmetsp:Transcript_15485/g.60600  ORF Transcript_15485/g.60600 Transcript_15485/m.60600 type:complete len:249 (+) Transcript_15485:771-1517(+)
MIRVEHRPNRVFARPHLQVRHVGRQAVDDEIPELRGVHREHDAAPRDVQPSAQPLRPAPRRGADVDAPPRRIDRHPRPGRRLLDLMKGAAHRAGVGHGLPRRLARVHQRGPEGVRAIVDERPRGDSRSASHGDDVQRVRRVVHPRARLPVSRARDERPRGFTPVVVARAKSLDDDVSKPRREASNADPSGTRGGIAPAEGGILFLFVFAANRRVHERRELRAQRVVQRVRVVADDGGVGEEDSSSFRP